MGRTSIEWCDFTFNPWIGCTKVSDGCKHCYAEALMDTRWRRVQWGVSGQRVRTSPANWKKPLKWNRDAEAKGVRYRVFCASLADVFEDKPDQPELDEWRKDLWNLIFETPHLDWLLLTKRPENVKKMMPHVWNFPKANHVQHGNIWIGTSVENQEQYEKRVPELLKVKRATGATVFLSMEPLLGPVDLQWCDWCGGFGIHDCYEETGTIDWVIVGGESGTNARPMHPDWLVSIRDQCVSSDIPFFFKQWGEWLPNDVRYGCHNPEANYNRRHIVIGGTGVGDVHMVRAGKKGAGRLLGGSEWNQFPLIASSHTTP